MQDRRIGEYRRATRGVVAIEDWFIGEEGLVGGVDLLLRLLASVWQSSIISGRIM